MLVIYMIIVHTVLEALLFDRNRRERKSKLLQYIVTSMAIFQYMRQNRLR